MKAKKLKKGIYKLTYKNRTYGRKYSTIPEVEGALMRMGQVLNGLGWTKCK